MAAAGVGERLEHDLAKLAREAVLVDGRDREVAQRAPVVAHRRRVAQLQEILRAPRRRLRRAAPWPARCARRTRARPVPAGGSAGFRAASRAARRGARARPADRPARAACPRLRAPARARAGSWRSRARAGPARDRCARRRRAPTGCRDRPRAAARSSARRLAGRGARPRARSSSSGSCDRRSAARSSGSSTSAASVARPSARSWDAYMLSRFTEYGFALDGALERGERGAPQPGLVVELHAPANRRDLVGIELEHAIVDTGRRRASSALARACAARASKRSTLGASGSFDELVGLAASTPPACCDPRPGERRAAGVRRSARRSRRAAPGRARVCSFGSSPPVSTRYSACA